MGLAKKAAVGSGPAAPHPSATATTPPAGCWPLCRRRRRWCSGSSPSMSTGGWDLQHQRSAQRRRSCDRAALPVDAQPGAGDPAESDLHRAAAVQRRRAPGAARAAGGRRGVRAGAAVVADRALFRQRAANATDYLLTRFLRCGRCGHGFVGTAAHGNGGATATTPALPASGTAPSAATRNASRPIRWRTPSSPRFSPRCRTGLSSKRLRNVPARRGTPTPGPAGARRRGPGAGRAARRRRPLPAGLRGGAAFGVDLRASCRRVGAGDWCARGAPGQLDGRVRDEPALPTGGDLAALRPGRAGDRRRRPRAAQATAGRGRGADHRGVPRLHPAVFRRAHGSYAYRFAEADGNRTRLSRDAAHTGFEDLNSYP